MNQSRNSVINLRCYPREKKAVDLIAHHEGRSISEMVREFIREGVKSRGYDSILFSELIDVLPLTEVFKADEKTG